MTTAVDSKRAEPTKRSRSETVKQTVYCINCGIDLRGNQVDGICPDCQVPVADSVLPDEVLQTTPAQIGRLYDASGLVYYPAMLLSALIVVALLGMAATMKNEYSNLMLIFDVGFFGAMVSPTVSLMGIFVLTRRRSPAYYSAHYGSPRAALRLGLLLAVLIAGMVAGIWYLGYVAKMLVLVAWFAFPNAVFLNDLNHLMRRVKRAKLGKLFRACAIWAYGLSLAALVVQLLRWERVQQPALEGPLVGLMLFTIVAGAALWFVVVRGLQAVRRTLRPFRGKGA